MSKQSGPANAGDAQSGLTWAPAELADPALDRLATTAGKAVQ